MNHNQLSSTAFFNYAKKLLPVLILFSIQFQFSFAQVQTQTAVSVKVSDYLKGYYESLPVDYKSNTTQKYPLLIFLHGVGERGNGTTQLPLVLKNAVPKIISKGQFPSKFRVGGKDFSFIVISPQYSSSSDYVTTIWKLIEHCKKKYRVDEKRIYLTGLSMGGLLAWNFAGASKTNADAFAAMVTVCGGGIPTAGRVANVASAKLPVWVTNNSGDPYNPASRAKETVDALNAYKPAPPKAVLTIFQKAGHDAWTQTYDPNFRQNGLNVYEWMLSYTSDGTSQASPEPPAPPVAKAGSNQTITLPVNSVTLSGSGSSASSGSIKSYSWKKTSGPSGGSIASSTSVSTKVTGLIQGVYKFELTVTDSNGNTSKATVTVTVNAAIPPPTAKAGSDQTITLPVNSVTLSGSGSSASSGSIKSYSWKKTSGPSGGSIASSTSVSTKVTGLAEGVYKFQLTVTDNNGKTATATITITVKAAPKVVPPTPNAGSTQTVTLPTNSVTLNGSASKAATGNTIKTYAWTKKSGPAGGTITSASSVSAKASALQEGTYVFQLKITDDKGSAATATVTVIVKAAPVTSALKANTGADQQILYPVNAVKLDGSKSTPGTDIKGYAWTKVSGPISVLGTSELTKPSEKITEAKNLVPGTYVFQLKVTDSKGKTATDKITITVTLRKGSLKANAGADQTIEYPLTKPLILDGSKSTAPNGNVRHGWTRLSGPGSSGAVLYPSVNLVTTTSKSLPPGVYKYQLTLTDADKNISRDTVVITVKSPEPEVALKANAGDDQTVVTPVSTVVLDGSSSAVAKGNSIKAYTWTKISGPNYAWDILTPSSAKTKVEKLVPGKYVFRLNVTDSKGTQSTDDVVVKVNFKSGVLKANAGPDRTVYLGSETSIKLDGSGSTVPGGNSDGIVAFWNRLSGPGSYGAVLYPSVVLNTTTGKTLVPGVYQYQLSIRDAKGNLSTDVVKITVKAGTAVSGRSAADEVEKEVVANVDDVNSGDLLELKINPNPVRSDMTVWIDGSATGKVSMLIYNLQGKVLMQQEFTKDAAVAISKSVNVSQLPAGSYLVQVIVDGKHRKSIQIIKQ